MERRGYFGTRFGGQYVSEALMSALKEIETEHFFVAKDQCFTNELNFYLEQYAGRKTPLYKAKNLSKKYGPDIYIKREDLLPYGGASYEGIAGQMIIGKRIGKKRYIMPTNDIAKGMILASLASCLNVRAEVVLPKYIAEGNPVEMQELKLTGAMITLKNDMQSCYDYAMRVWIARSSAVTVIAERAFGPYPIPLMVREYEKVVGEEIKEQLKAENVEHPDLIIGYGGGDATTIGVFSSYLDDPVKKVVAESTEFPFLTEGKPGIELAMCSLFMMDEDMNVMLDDSRKSPLYISGADPELAYMVEDKKAFVSSITPEEAMTAAIEFNDLEGFLVSEKSAYTIATLLKNAASYTLDETIVCIISGRPDKNWISACAERMSIDE